MHILLIATKNTLVDFMISILLLLGTFRKGKILEVMKQILQDNKVWHMLNSEDVFMFMEEDMVRKVTSHIIESSSLVYQSHYLNKVQSLIIQFHPLPEHGGCGNQIPGLNCIFKLRQFAKFTKNDKKIDSSYNFQDYFRLFPLTFPIRDASLEQVFLRACYI